MNLPTQPAPAPTPTDVSAAAREAAREEAALHLRRFQGHENVPALGAAVQALLDAQRTTDRQRISEMEAALRDIRDGNYNNSHDCKAASKIAQKALLP